MSAARVNKLKALLGRVQERRAQPRLSAVVSTSDSTRTTTEPDLPRISAVPAPAAVSSPTPATPAEEAAALFASQSSAPPRGRDSESSRAPTMEDLPSIPPLDKLPEPPAPEKLPAKAPPAARSATHDDEISFEDVSASRPAPAPVTEVEAPITAPSARIDAQPLSAAAPVARVVAPARVETPKTFGELLEISLSLRPR